MLPLSPPSPALLLTRPLPEPPLLSHRPPGRRGNEPTGKAQGSLPQAELWDLPADWGPVLPSASSNRPAPPVQGLSNSPVQTVAGQVRLTASTPRGSGPLGEEENSWRADHRAFCDRSTNLPAPKPSLHSLFNQPP